MRSGMFFKIFLLSQVFGHGDENHERVSVQTSMSLPAGCSGERDLSVPCSVASWEPGKTGMKMTLKTTVPELPVQHWAGVGFSKTGSMLDGDVYVCESDGKETKLISGFSHSRTDAPMLFYQPIGIKNDSIETLTYGNEFICHFTVTPTVSKNDIDFRYAEKNNSGSFYAIMATGVHAFGMHRYHGYGYDHRAHSSKPIDFRKLSELSTEENDLRIVEVDPKQNSGSNFYKIHAVLAILAWGLIMPFSILFSAGFRRIYPTKFVFQKPIWFLGHSSLSLIGFLLTLISIIFIFVQQKAWSKSAGWHGVFGILVLCISAIETIFGIFRPEKDSSWRPAFRYMHTFVGYLCYIFAVIAIGFGIQMPVSGYFWPNSWPTSSLVAYVICVCIFGINIAGFYLINFNATKLKNWQKLGIFIPAVVATVQNEK